ncbi:MAG: leucine-rich repeat domain-containing protein [Ruminococcus sp.]|nr:leucine-rich repeat domain-containing protein [Ruminococcus sp.]
MNLKKLFVTAVTAVMCFSFATLIPAYADNLQGPEDALTDGIFTYELVNGSYTIVSCDSNSIVESIPSMRNGYAITAIGDDAFIGCKGISELEIPNTVRSIGMNAFVGCTSLKKVVIPDTVTEISSCAFMRCTALTDVELPDTITTIGNYAFAQCVSLESMKLPESLTTINPEAFTDCYSISSFDVSECPSFVFEDGILYNKAKSEIYRGSVELEGDLYIDNSVSVIRPGAFSACQKLENLFIPSSVSTIGADAFSNCHSLKNVDLEQGITILEAGAFMYCSSLESVSIPTTITEIGEETFAYCSGLSKAIIPEGVTSVGASAFLGCDNLEKINIPKSVNTIGENAFGYTLNGQELTTQENFSMSVYSGSSALKYAKYNKIDYTVADRSLKKTAFIIIAVGLILAVAVFAVVLMSRGKKGASVGAKKAKKIEKEKKAEENYEKIVGDDK